MKKVKIKNLPKDFVLDGCKLNGQYIISGWPKGFWVKNKMSDSQVYLVLFKSFEEVKEWTIEVPFGRLPFK